MRRVKKGFSLIETVVAISILLILVSAVGVNKSNLVQQVYLLEEKKLLRLAANALGEYFTETRDYRFLEGYTGEWMESHSSSFKSFLEYHPGVLRNMPTADLSVGGKELHVEIRNYNAYTDERRVKISVSIGDRELYLYKGYGPDD